MVDSSRSNYIKIICLLLFAIPISVWIGWEYNIELLKSILPGITAMNPVTAVCFLILGIGLFLTRNERMSKQYKLTSQVLGGLVCLVGAIMLLKYFTGIDTGLDRVFFSSKLGANRLAPNTALNFFITGLALVSINASIGVRRPAQFLSILSMSLCGLVIIGYVYGVRSFYGVSTFIPMALHTSICFILFCSGILHARPDKGGMKIITAPFIGGTVSRLILAATIIPFSIGAMGVIGYHHGEYEFAMGIALIVTGTIFLSTALIWQSGVLLYAAELKREEFQQRLNKKIVISSRVRKK